MEKPPFARDMELVRAILFWAEKGGLAADRPGEETVALCYHVKIMVEAGLIEGAGEFRKMPGTNEFKEGLAQVKQLTWKGHEFLEAVRSETTWKKVKEVFSQHGVPFVSEILVSVVKALVARQTGLPLA